MASGLIAYGQAVTYAGNERLTNRGAQQFVLGLPHQQDVGHVTSAGYVVLYLWNGTVSETVLTSITGDEGSDGIGWDATPPEVVSALSSLQVVLEISPTGPLEFTATLSFISSCHTIALVLTGTRAPALSGDIGMLFMAHNWEAGLNESLEWKTDVLVAHDRTEQRIKLRTRPRRAWDIRLLIEGDARRKVDNWLGQRMKRYLFSPVWRDVTKTLEEVTPWTTMIEVETEYLDFAVGRWVALFDGWDSFEIRSITGIGPNYLSVDVPFERSWPAGSSITPCRYGLAQGGRSLKRFTEDVGDYRFRFEAQDESLMPDIESPEEYKTIPVCPVVPAWTGGSEEETENSWLRLDNETGLVEFDITSVEPIFRRDVSFLLIGRERIDTFLRFLFYCSGRLAPFWLSSGGREFELVLPAAQDATEIVISNIDYTGSLVGSPARSHIELVTTSGDVIRRAITGVQVMPDLSEKLQLDAGLPRDISAANLNRCAWLELVRLDSDEVNLHWVSWECVEVSLPIVVLP